MPGVGLSANPDAGGETIETPNNISRPQRDSVALTGPAKDEAMTREEALAVCHVARLFRRMLYPLALLVSRVTRGPSCPNPRANAVSSS